MHAICCCVCVESCLALLRHSRPWRDLPTIGPSSRQQARPLASDTQRTTTSRAKSCIAAVGSRPTTISSCTTTVACCQPSRSACRWHDTATSAATQQGDGGATRTTTSSKGGGGRSSDSRTGGMGSRDMQGICKRCIGSEGRAMQQTEAAHRGSSWISAAILVSRPETHPKVRQGCSGRPASHESSQYDH
ncbi:hypothetical protein BC831DRAFT_457568 [Entophlyctis helioformis]|nr:hypothetical protein BC831DRAFT_457568 [Entophlyctis helioformis]